MELDELKNAWRKLDTGATENASAGDGSRLRGTRWALRISAGTPLFELGANALALMWLGRFVAGHGDEARFLSPALLLCAALLAALAAGLTHLILLARIDYAAPVLAIQRRLAAIATLRLRTTQYLLLLAPLLWLPLLIVALRGLAGVDGYRLFGTGWLLANLAFGIAVIPSAIWVARRYGSRMKGSRLGRRLADDIAGRSLTRARGFLDEIGRFENAA